MKKKLVFGISVLLVIIIVKVYNNEKTPIHSAEILMPPNDMYFYQTQVNETVTSKNVDYENIFCEAEKYFLEIARNPDTVGDYNHIITGSCFLDEEDYYYINPEEYYDSVKVIMGEAKEEGEHCTVGFIARVYASDKSKNLGKVNPDVKLFYNRNSVRPELQYIGLYNSDDGKFHVLYEKQFDRSSLVAAADVEGIEQQGLRKVVPPQISVRGMEEYESVIAEMLMRIVQEPNTISEYKNVFTEESIETVENFEWYYRNPSEIYNLAQIRITEQDDLLRYEIQGLIIAGNENPKVKMNEKVKEKLSKNEQFLNGLPGIAKVYLIFSLEYDVKTGVFWIKSIDYCNDFHAIEHWTKGVWFTYTYDSQGIMHYHIKEGYRDGDFNGTNKFERDFWNDSSVETPESFEYYSIRKILYETPPPFWGEEQLVEYSQNLFQAITMHKDILPECETLLSEESIALIQATKWPDTDLFLQLDWAETVWEEVKLDQYVKGKTKITTHYIDIPCEKYWEVEYTWSMTNDLCSKFEVEHIEWEEKENPEKSIRLNEAIPHMTRKEVSAYTGKLFMLLVREPDKIEEYKDVFSTESIEAWKQVKWYYARPEQVYDDASSGGYDVINKTGTTLVGSHYRACSHDFGDIPVNEAVLMDPYYLNCIEGFGSEDHRESPMFDWLVHIDWIYEDETGSIIIKEIEILPNIHQLY